MDQNDGLTALIAECERNIEDLEQKLEIEKGVLARLRKMKAVPQQMYTTVRLTEEPRRAKKLPDQILELMQTENRPMRAKEIAEALEKQGVKAGSKRGLRPLVVSTLIRRTDRFRPREGERGVYELV